MVSNFGDFHLRFRKYVTSYFPLLVLKELVSLLNIVCQKQMEVKAHPFL